MNLIAGALMVIGVVVMTIAVIGMIRLPDVYMRLSACTKAATLGIGCILIAAAISFDDFATTCRALAIIVFVFLTAPVAGHMIGRAAYVSGAPLWEGTFVDELKGRYDIVGNVLQSSAPPEPPQAPFDEDGRC